MSDLDCGEAANRRFGSSPAYGLHGHQRCYGSTRRPRCSFARSVKDAAVEAILGPTIAESAEKYLASRRHEIGDKTLGQHRLLLNRLNKFCESKNAVYMRDLNVDLLETFKTEEFPDGMADTSKATAVAKLRCFLRTAYRRDWIKASLVDK